MAENFARKARGQKAVPKAEAQERILGMIQDGFKVKEAVAAVGRTEATYLDWMKGKNEADIKFRDSIKEIREGQAEERETGRPPVPDFDEFCRDWLHQPLHAHQLRMWDVIEGRTPRDLHDSMTYRPGYLNRVLVNLPPDHAKTTTFSVNYIVWQIHKDPNVRVVIMSQGRGLAARILGEIKHKLTSPVYRPMHMRFAPRHPDGTTGWKDPDSSWTNDAIYVMGKGTDQNKVRDPTVQVLGLSGQIYGTRADIIILDDAVTTKNAGEIEKQMILLDREIESRLPSEQQGGGLLLILGTRIAPVDLYRTLLDVEDGDGEPVWTYLRQPAVLDYGNGDSASWTTLWPEQYSGKSLARRKRDISWNLVYQQLNVNSDMTFSVQAVDASLNKLRFPGPMTKAGIGHRENGMEGLYIVAGLDPAANGNTAMIVAGLDRDGEKRYILDGFNKENCTAQQMLDQMRKFTDMYGIHEWVIERNAVQRFIAQEPHIVQFMRTRGARITEHYTTANKRDADWGIQTMAPLFESCGVPDENNPSGRWKRTPETALIELPSPRQNEWVNDLIQQLTIWQPDGMAQLAKTDLVMALWFTHIAFSRILQRSRKHQTHLNTPFMTPHARKRQQVISLSAIRAERQRQRDLMEGVS